MIAFARFVFVVARFPERVLISFDKLVKLPKRVVVSPMRIAIFAFAEARLPERVPIVERIPETVPEREI